MFSHHFSPQCLQQRSESSSYLGLQASPDGGSHVVDGDNDIPMDRGSQGDQDLPFLHTVFSWRGTGAKVEGLSSLLPRVHVKALPSFRPSGEEHSVLCLVKTKMFHRENQQSTGRSQGMYPASCQPQILLCVQLSHC